MLLLLAGRTASERWTTGLDDYYWTALKMRLAGGLV
jgi:hypothetical protein